VVFFNIFEQINTRTFKPVLIEEVNWEEVWKSWGKAVVMHSKDYLQYQSLLSDNWNHWCTCWQWASISLKQTLCFISI